MHLIRGPLEPHSNVPAPVLCQFAAQKRAEQKKTISTQTERG